MTDKIGGNKKITGVSTTSKTDAVEKAGAVTESSSVDTVKGVKATSGVGAVKGVRLGKDQPTQVWSPEEKQKLLRMLSEEADKMVETGLIPEGKKAVVQGAVKMSVQAGWTEDADPKNSVDDDGDKKGKK